VELAGGALRAAGAAAEELYARVVGFEPRELDQQRAEERAPVLDALEREQGERWVSAAAAVIGRAAAGARRIAVGVALPGLKTADGRGTRVVAHGPRIPDYAGRLEAALVSAGLEPAAPIGPLESDGRCAGLGELRAAGGALRGARCAYYAGGGSGLAEALVLDGEVVDLDAAGGWFPRAWELAAPGTGGSYEEQVALSAVNARWRGSTGRAADDPALPEECLEREVEAVAALTNLGTQLARLLHARLAALTGRGYAPERLVVGQRLGLLLADLRTEFCLRAVAERELVRLLDQDPDGRLARRYLTADERALAPGLLVASTLRLAPALGAALCAERRLAARGGAG
jgi:hypothetical protein